MGKRWTPEELRILLDLVEKGLTVQEIVDSGKLPDRNFLAVQSQVKRIKHGPSARQKKKFFAGQITSVDIISLEEVLKRWSCAYQQICDLESASKEELERFRIIFMAASKYAALLEAYHQYAEVEQRLERIERVLEELQKDRSGKGEQA
jgi:hypothetical protein